MATLTSRQNPIVARFRAAARRDSPDVLLLDGAHLVGEALDAGLTLREVAITAGANPGDEIASLVDRAERHGVPVNVVSTAVMDALSPVRSPSAVVALAERPVHNAADVYGKSPLVVVAFDIQDPGNLGAIVRVAEAGGATGVVCAGVGADPFGWKALRGSMGSLLRLPVVVAARLADAVADARRHDCRIVAAVPRDGVSLFAAALHGPVAILIGGEGGGLAPADVADADERIAIPMHPPVESLNASVAAALLVYEARRQRMGTA